MYLQYLAKPSRILQPKKMNKFLPIVVIVLTLFLVATCNENKKLQRDISRHQENYFNNENNYRKKINELGQEVSRQNVSLVESNAQRKALEKQIKDLKRLKSKVDIVIETIYDSVVVGFVDTLKDENTIQVPKQLYYKSEWISFSQLIAKNYTRIDSLKINNGINITVGKFNTGFLKSEYQAEVTLTNPHSSTLSMKSLMVKENKRKSFFAGVGIGAAIVTGLILIK